MYIKQVPAIIAATSYFAGHYFGVQKLQGPDDCRSLQPAPQRRRCGFQCVRHSYFHSGPQWFGQEQFLFRYHSAIRSLIISNTICPERHVLFAAFGRASDASARMREWRLVSCCRRAQARARCRPLWRSSSTTPISAFLYSNRFVF